MTATPIPRSLALTVFGDLDISVIDQMPEGRQPINTYVLRPQERERAFTLIRGQIKEGRQAFIVYPLIDESEKIEARAAVDDFETLSKQIFPDLKLGLLHGRMKPAEKDDVMMKFRDRQYDILVSTTVVEVGDVYKRQHKARVRGFEYCVMSLRSNVLLPNQSETL